MTDRLSPETETFDAERIPSWPPVKMALWRVLMDEKLNDGHYIRAFDLIEKLHAAVVSSGLAQRPTGIEARLEDAYAALRSIAEGNLGDASWQANYETIKQIARNALSNTSTYRTLGESK